MNKIFSIVLILVVIVLGGYFFLGKEDAQAPSQESPQVLDEATDNLATDSEIKDILGAETEEILLVNYTNLGYSPSVLTVKTGRTVTFNNDSSLSMWPASASHPTHKVYPTTGGCLGSTFDACKGVLPGDSWSFKFDIAGTWKYHDHLKPTFFGTIIVE